MVIPVTSKILKLAYIIIRPTPGWADLALGQYQVLPQDGKPLSLWPPSEIHEAWAYIATQIKTAAQRLQK